MHQSTIMLNAINLLITHRHKGSFMKDGLTFSTFLLQINNQNLSKTQLAKCKFPYEKIIECHDKCKKYHASLKRNFLLLSITEGKFLPLSENVYDRILEKDKPNQRNENEAEWLSQTFALYNFKSEILYLSNSNKKIDIKDLFLLLLNDEELFEIEILNIYKDIDSFIDEVREIGKIRFTRKPDNQKSIFDDQIDFDPRWASDAKFFTVELHYDNFPKAKQWLKRFFKPKIGEEISSLTCYGYDDKKVEKIFKVDSFLEKITVDVSRNARGLYEESLVFKNAMEKIE